jgi:hypothetical protein
MAAPKVGDHVRNKQGKYGYGIVVKISNSETISVMSDETESLATWKIEDIKTVKVEPSATVTIYNHHIITEMHGKWRVGIKGKLRSFETLDEAKTAVKNAEVKKAEK